MNNPGRQGEKELTTALRVIRNALYAKTIYARFPLLEEITERLGYQIGNEINLNEVMPIPGKEPTPLYHACLKSAFRRFDIAMNEVEPTPRSVMTAYINGLLGLTYELSFVDVRTADGKEQWDPLADPFVEWKEKHPKYTIDNTDNIQFSKHPHPKNVRGALLRRILSKSDFMVLAEKTDINIIIGEAA